MKKLLIGLLLVSFMVSAEPEKKEEVGRYKIEITTYVSKKNNVYVLETIFDTKTGKATFPGIDAIQKQAYNEMTADGLPEGGDAQAVKESHKLAEEIVNAKKGDWIYESPDGGKTVFRRPFSDYNPENKEEIDWETKEPTGRKFSEYNNGHWEKGNEG